MNGIRELLTDICLVGAAVSSVAWLVLANRRMVARVSALVAKVPRSSLAAFLVAALVATLSAQKPDGTNAPPNGASPSQMMGMLPQGLLPLNLHGDGGVVSVTSNDIVRGFLLQSVITNGSYSYAMPTNGTRYARWWKRGGYDEEKILLCVACVNAAKDNALMPRGSEGTKLTLEDVFVFNRRKLAGNGVASLAEFKKIIHAYRARTHRTRLKKLDAARQKKSANAEKNGIIHGVSCS